jgi:hypothetical protein
MRIPPVLRQRTLWLVLGPLVALVAVVAVTRLGGGSPAEERAARASTTTTTAPSTTTTAPGDAVTPPSTPESGSAAAAAEVLGVQEDAGFSEGESLAGVGFEDGAATEVLGESFTQLDLVVPPPDPVTPPTTTPPPVPTTAPPTTVPPTTTPTTAPSTTNPTTTTTVPPSVQVQSRTVTLQLACSVTNQAGSVPVTAVVGISTLTGVPTGTNLPVLVGLLGPPNLLGEALRDDLVQTVRLSAVGTGAPPLQLETSNPLPLAAGAVVPIPDGGDDFLAGTFAVSSPAGGGIVVQFDSVSFSRTVGGQQVDQSCVGAQGAPTQLASLGIVAPGTPTTSVPLPPPVVSESPITALLPISAVVVVGAALALLVRRRRSDAVGGGSVPGGTP